MEIYVYRNGERRAGPFLKLADAESHSRNMQRISINLKKYRDKWYVVCEHSNKERKILSDKEKRAVERKARMDAEIAKSLKQYRKRKG